MEGELKDDYYGELQKLPTSNGNLSYGFNRIVFTRPLPRVRFVTKDTLRVVCPQVNQEYYLLVEDKYIDLITASPLHT